MSYYRCKTGQRAAQHISEELSKTLALSQQDDEEDTSSQPFNRWEVRIEQPSFDASEYALELKGSHCTATATLGQSASH